MTEYPPVPPPPGGYPPPPPGGYPPPPPYAAKGGINPTALQTDAYTPWGKRVGAWVIDILPAAILSGIGQGIAIATGDNQCVTDNTDGFSTACTSSYSVVGLVASFVFGLLTLGYVIWNYGYRQGATGSSIGKSVLKFQVVSEKTSEPIGFAMSIVRQLAHVVDAVICYIGYLFPLWDAKRQTLADKIMTTVCVPIT